MNIKGFYEIHRGRFILVFAMVTIGMAIDTSTQYLMTPAYNNLKNLNFSGFLFFLILTQVLDLMRLLLISGSDYLFSQQTQNYLHKIRIKISRFIFKNNITETAKVQNDLNANLDQLTKNYATPLKNVYMYALDVILSIIILFYFNWILAILTLILTIISLVLPKLFENMTSKATIQVTEKNKSLLNSIAKWINGLDELRRYASFDIFNSSLNQSTTAYKKAAIKQGQTVAIADVVSAGFNTFGQVILMLLCGYLYFQGQIVFGAVMTTIAFSSTVMNGITYLVSEWNLIKSTKELNQKISAMEKPVKIAKNQHGDQNIAELKIENLGLHFPNGEKITYPDLEVKKGEKVLLLGDSGTGKSTLFKLILGKLKPTQGKISFVDEQGDLNINSDEIGYVAQDGILFPGSIQDNITMFDPKLNKLAEKAVQWVDLNKDIEKFPAGIKTAVDLDQDNLSGGQKQKIILARALVYQTKWLFIDEGTSAIDSEATKKVLKNLLKTDRTIVMIAHNFSNELINAFDRKIVLSNGQAGETDEL